MKPYWIQFPLCAPMMTNSSPAFWDDEVRYLKLTEDINGFITMLKGA
jgi:hypothetical protein